MKLVKMSLAAAMLMGASAFAIENVKVSGDAKLFYGTDDVDNSNVDMFDQDSAYGETAISLGATADLTEGVSAGATLNAVSTLGLYNNLVSATWTGGVEDYYWFSEAWLAGTAGKTTAKAGRMLLDTPLVFSETWTVAPNTFEAAVLINQDLPDTTLVAAYVGQSNGAAVLGGGFDDGFGDSINNSFESFYNGAYAYGIVNNSFEPLTAQAWYFSAQQAVDAYWLQADVNVEGIVAGAIYTGITYKTGLTGAAADIDNSAYAVKLGYEAEAFTVSAAYSAVDDADGTYAAGAAFNLDGAQSKLYTEAWWNYGYISQADTAAYNVTATYSMADVADFGIYYTDADQEAVAGDNDMSEITLEVAKSFGPLDTGLYYIMTDVNENGTSGDVDYDSVQVYLTYNF